MVLVVVLYALLALTFILAKKAVTFAQPCFLIGFRMIMAGVILIGFHLFRHEKKWVIKAGDYWLFFKTSIFHIYLAFVLEFWALQHITALKTTLIYSSTPFIAALLSYALLNERLSWQKCFGIVIGLGGLIPVLMANSTSEGVANIASLSLPEIVLFIAVVSSAYAWFLVKDLMKKGYSLSMINGTAMLAGGLMSLATSAVFEGLAYPVYDWVPFLGWVFALILVANVIVYNLYGWLFNRYSITFIAFSGFLCPGFGTLYEWLFMGTAITWHYFASLILVTVGLYIFYCDELKRSSLQS